MFIAYPHSGKDGTNPHFHICIPTTAPQQDVARIRQRLNRKFKGNQEYSLKSCVNGLLAAIQYMSREGTDPIFKGDDVAVWIESAPKWEDKVPSFQTTLDKKRKNPDNIPQITYGNMFIVCARWRARFALKRTDLTDIIEHMCDAGTWQLSASVHKGGIPETMLAEFVQFVSAPAKRKNNFKALIYKPGYQQFR